MSAQPQAIDTPELRQRREHEQAQQVYHTADPNDADNASVMTTDKDSPGVRRIEAITSVWNMKDRVIFLGALVVMTYART